MFTAVLKQLTNESNASKVSDTKDRPKKTNKKKKELKMKLVEEILIERG